MTIKLSEVPPQIAENFGWNYDAATNDELVTLVRYRTLIEEIVVSREKFNQLNEDVENGELYWNELEWEDAQCDDYCEEKTSYCAYEGDITSFTDDAVAFMYPDAEWVECFTSIDCVAT
jgi:hypothetical protein